MRKLRFCFFFSFFFFLTLPPSPSPPPSIITPTAINRGVNFTQCDSASVFTRRKLWLLTAVHLSERLLVEEKATGETCACSLKVRAYERWLSTREFTPNFCSGVYQQCLQIAAVSAAMCLITTGVIKTSEWNAANQLLWLIRKMPGGDVKRWLCSRLMEDLNTLGWHFSTCARLDFIDICLKKCTQRKFLLSILLIFLKRGESIWGEEIRNSFTHKQPPFSCLFGVFFFPPSFSQLLLDVKKKKHDWHMARLPDFSMPSLWFKINARQKTKCSLWGEKDKDTGVAIKMHSVGFVNPIKHCRMHRSQGNSFTMHRNKQTQS